MTASKKTVTHTVVKFVGSAGTRRVITKADQDRLIGVKGVATKDLVWEQGNTKLDVTGAHEEVLEYFKTDSEFKVTHVEAPADPS
jgi:hypothetical protein